MNVGYRFGPFVLDPAQRAVTREGAPVPLTRKGFELLLYLVQHPNRIVTKQDLMKAVWPDTFVEEGNLTQNISLLRRALGRPGEAPLIVTVAREGYKFTADVMELDSLPSGVEAVPGPSRRPARIRWRMWRRDVSAAALPDPRVGERVYDEVRLDGRGRHRL